jgi:hypothetical protein
MSVTVSEITANVTINNKDGFHKVSAVAAYQLPVMDKVQAAGAHVPLRCGENGGAGESCKGFYRGTLR